MVSVTWHASECKTNTKGTSLNFKKQNTIAFTSVLPGVSEMKGIVITPDTGCRTKHTCRAGCVGLPVRELSTSSAVCMVFVTEPNTPAELFVSVFQRGNSLPAHLYVQISASYQSATGQNKNWNDWLDFSVNGSILNPSSAAFTVSDFGILSDWVQSQCFFDISTICDFGIFSK